MIVHACPCPHELIIRHNLIKLKQKLHRRSIMEVAQEWCFNIMEGYLSGHAVIPEKSEGENRKHSIQKREGVKQEQHDRLTAAIQDSREKRALRYSCFPKCSFSTPIWFTLENQDHQIKYDGMDNIKINTKCKKLTISQFSMDEGRRSNKLQMAGFISFGSGQSLLIESLTKIDRNRWYTGQYEKFGCISEHRPQDKAT